jgi:hypothetical protein
MCRVELPRLYELSDLIADAGDPDVYFHNFDELLRDTPSIKQSYLALERSLQGLDIDAWDFLKNEAYPYLTKRCKVGRGWQQLLTILNQARAHNYLRAIGCSSVAFIPRAACKGIETPDLQGELDDKKVLCEVKTINISDDEVNERQCGAARLITEKPLALGFFNKLSADIDKAKEQMNAFDNRPHIRRIAYIIVNFDNFWGDYKERQFQQIDQFCARESRTDIELVFHNLRTRFHKPLNMTSATVVND